MAWDSEMISQGMGDKQEIEANTRCIVATLLNADCSIY